MVQTDFEEDEGAWRWRERWFYQVASIAKATMRSSCKVWMGRYTSQKHRETESEGSGVVTLISSTGLSIPFARSSYKAHQRRTRFDGYARCGLTSATTRSESCDSTAKEFSGQHERCTNVIHKLCLEKPQQIARIDHISQPSFV